MSTCWVCVDANMVVRLVADPTDKVVSALWAQWNERRQPMAAPALLPYEVTNALYRYQKLGYMTAESARSALKAALALPVRFYPDLELHEDARRLAERFSLPSAYDAHYLALADRLGGEFWTLNGRLARAVQPSLSWVHLAE
jgi:predicted nucleic acid-binding protein